LFRLLISFLILGAIYADNVPKPKPIGYISLGYPVFIRHFTTAPGGKGLPKTNVGIARGIVPVYQLWDWTKLDTNLHGNHKWYKVNPTNSYWIYAQDKYEYRSVQ
jgi:hypothetical protein